VRSIGEREISGLLRRLIDGQRLCVKRRCLLEPHGLEIFEQTFAPAFAAKTTLAITPETARASKRFVQFTQTTRL